MADDPPADARRYPRFSVRNLDQVYVVVQRTRGAESETLLAEPLDISEGGIKLRVETPLIADEQVELNLGCVEGPFRVTLFCRVVWLRQDRHDSWRLGCEFVPKLPREMMEELFGTIIERRQSPRRAVRLDILAKWELQPGLFAVRLVNISEGGFCILSGQPGQIGQRIWLKPDVEDETTSVLGSARWCSTCLADGFHIGCAFPDHSSYLSLRTALDSAGTLVG